MTTGGMLSGALAIPCQLIIMAACPIGLPTHYPLGNNLHSPKAARLRQFVAVG